MTEVRRAAVFGAGVMGSGIAAQIANAGVPVLLFDVPAEDGDRDALAKRAITRLSKEKPAPLMAPETAGLITPCNVEDHLDRLADCDWIIEAVVEKSDVKRALYARIAERRAPGSAVSSNTSTIPLAELVRGLPEDFRRGFLITHFFNPPRYMRLVETVAGEDTRRETVDALTRFLDRELGKTVIPCFDSPGFIANRIGAFWLQCAVVEAIDGGLTVEEADAVIGRPFGIPKSGVFGLLDLVGLDLMPHVSESLAASLPADDPFHAVRRPLLLVERMIADGYTGRKGKGGFYRLRDGEGGERIKQAIDLETGEYVDAQRPRPKTVQAAKRGGPKALLSADDRYGRYAWRVMSRTLAYAARVAPQVTDRIADVDRAVRLGYNWRKGPFELIDAIGAEWFADALRRDGQEVPALLQQAAGRRFYKVENGALADLHPAHGYRPITRPEGMLLLEDVKRRSRPLARNPSASLWDIGDGVACLEFHSKMNAIDPLTLWMIRRAVRIVERRFRALVLYNEAEQFSVGANIGLLPFLAAPRAWFLIDWLVRLGQRTYRRLKYAPFPVVGAPSGMALGGGCEVLLHCDAIEAHAETYVGLVEAGVGLVPAWGGCTAMLARLAADPDGPKGPMPPTSAAFETLATARVATSAAEARRLGFLRPGDGIVMNRDRLLAAAKARALTLATGYRAPAPATYVLAGPAAKAALDLFVAGYRRQGKATAHDVAVAGALGEVLSGGDTDLVDHLSEGDLLRLERRAFMRLVGTAKTQARIRHVLRTGKPLRN